MKKKMTQIVGTNIAGLNSEKRKASGGFQSSSGRGTLNQTGELI